MMKKAKGLNYLDRVTKTFEIAIAILLLVAIAIKAFELVFELSGHPIIVIPMDFKSILSASFALVLGVEFTKMLIKHTPESVVDVLLFAIARQMVVYHERTLDLLIGVTAIAGLFAIKKVLLGVNLLSSWKDIKDVD
jgi:hypothetical protein